LRLCFLYMHTRVSARSATHTKDPHTVVPTNITVLLESEVGKSSYRSPSGRVRTSVAGKASMCTRNSKGECLKVGIVTGATLLLEK